MKAQKILPLLAILFAMLACNLPSNAPNKAATLAPQYTAAAQTLEAIVEQSKTPAPTSIISPPTLIPTSTSIVLPHTATSVPWTSTPVVRCDSAAFVKDVTYPDGAVVERSESFNKIWRVKNTGTCTWTSGYSFVFMDGNILGAPAFVNLKGNVAPGQEVDLSVTMTAPSKDGTYAGYWMLRNASGVLFGLGPQADGRFFVNVKVSGPTFTYYDFALNACQANWRNNNSSLPCPGSDGDERGYILQLSAPKMEGGKVENIPGLLTYPKNSSDGLIQGDYPAIRIQDGDRFKAWINCQYNANSCNVKFLLQYQIGNGDIKTLGEWHEVYEGRYYPLNIDLSSLAGKDVKFILKVLANGSANQDYALWVGASIVRPGVAPATLTPTAIVIPTATSTEATATATEGTTP